MWQHFHAPQRSGNITRGKQAGDFGCPGNSHTLHNGTHFICVYYVCIYVSDTGIYIYIHSLTFVYMTMTCTHLCVYIYIYGRYVGYKPLTNWDAHPSRELGIIRSLVFRCAWRCPFAIFCRLHDLCFRISSVFIEYVNKN